MTPHITTCHQKASASAPSGASLAELLLDTISLIHGQRTTAVAVGSQTAPDPEASSRLGTHTAATRAWLLPYLTQHLRYRAVLGFISVTVASCAR